MLVLSTSREEDEDERNYSQLASNVREVVDPKKLIQFKELEQESFSFSRQGDSENFLKRQMSGENIDYLVGADGIVNFSKNHHHLDALSLDTNGSLHASNLI